MFRCWNSNFTSDQEYHDWLNRFKPLLIPNKPSFNGDPDKNTVFYDVHANTLHYLPYMIYLNSWFEEFDMKQFHSFPLRSSIKPHYVTVDTAVLVDLLMTADKQKMRDNIKQNQHQVWADHFKLNNKVFKRNHFTFKYMMKTDGVGVSLLFLRNDLVGKTRIPEPTEFVEQYITDVPNKDDLKPKKIVGIDPNKADIIYCVDEQRKTFRYTANQRRFETNTKRYNKELIADKETVLPEGYTVFSCERVLSKQNSKTSKFDKFQEYIKYKTEINNRLFTFYQQEKYRRHKFNVYTNSQRSEAKMINNFRRKYGEPDNVVIAFGDHEQHQQMRYHEPTKDIGMRRLFRKHGFEVLLVDEFRTSKACNKCGCNVENFLRRPSGRPWKRGEEVLVHGLVRCTNASCGIKWNRDFNAALNILEAARCSVFGQERPMKLMRGIIRTTTSTVVQSN